MRTKETTTMLTVRLNKPIGTRATIAYAFVIALGAIVCGLGVNALPPELLPDVAVTAGTEHVTWFEHASAALLVLCLAMQLKSRRFTAFPRNPARTTKETSP